MRFLNPFVLIGLILVVFLVNMVAQASPNPGNIPDFAESSREKPLRQAPLDEHELRAASDEWEVILEILNAGNDQVAGPGGRATSCRTVGTASYYGPGFHGRKTANGERFNAHGITAAHRSLPFGTQVKVTSVATGRVVTVRINDRGPFSGGRIIDLSAGAARAIGITLGKVQLECT